MNHLTPRNVTTTLAKEEKSQLRREARLLGLSLSEYTAYILRRHMTNKDPTTVFIPKETHRL